MKTPIDIVQLVKELPKRPRGRAFIVLTHDYYGQKDWASKLAEITGSGHIDLLEAFAGNEALCAKMRGFLVVELFKMLERTNSESILIVSGMEFLKATWAGIDTVMEQFANQVETWNKKPFLVFVLQYDKALATRDFRRFPQYSFVVDQKETLAL